ncbi:MAG: hypothetical protein RLZ63_12 [Pseudomonadota bacterium]
MVAGAGNQYVDFFGQRLVDAPVAAIRCGRLDVRIAAAKTVFVELHIVSPVCVVNQFEVWGK